MHSCDGCRIANTSACYLPLSDDLYTQLKSSLMERVKDKESAVRVQAVFALSKFQGGEDEFGDNEDNVVQKLVDMIQHDMSS